METKKKDITQSFNWLGPHRTELNDVPIVQNGGERERNSHTCKNYSFCNSVCVCVCVCRFVYLFGCCMKIQFAVNECGVYDRERLVHAMKTFKCRNKFQRVMCLCAPKHFKHRLLPLRCSVQILRIYIVSWYYYYFDIIKTDGMRIATYKEATQIAIKVAAGIDWE